MEITYGYLMILESGRTVIGVDILPTSNDMHGMPPFGQGPAQPICLGGDAAFKGRVFADADYSGHTLANSESPEGHGAL